MIDPNNADFAEALKQMRNFRQVCVNKNLDPWSVRAAIAVILQIDKVVAMKKGIKADELDMADLDSIEYANKLAGMRGFSP